MILRIASVSVCVCVYEEGEGGAVGVYNGITKCLRGPKCEVLSLRH